MAQAAPKKCRGAGSTQTPTLFRPSTPRAKLSRTAPLGESSLRVQLSPTWTPADDNEEWLFQQIDAGTNRSNLGKGFILLLCDTGCIQCISPPLP